MKIDFNSIEQIFQKFLNDNIKENNNLNWKFKCISVFENTVKNKINDIRTREVFELFDRNGLLIDKYIEALL